MNFWEKYRKVILFALGCLMILAGVVALIASYRAASPKADALADVDQDLIDEPVTQITE